jgi:hypothetical protein
MAFQKLKAWIRPYPCVSLRADGSACKNAVAAPNTRCGVCWVDLATSPNGLLRVRIATELATIKGVNADAFGRLMNDPVTAVRLGVLEHSRHLSSGWQEHAANDPEAVVWRALAKRHDLSNAAAIKLISNNDDATLSFLIDNPRCPVSVLRWVTHNREGDIQQAAQSALDAPLDAKLKNKTRGPS